ncbi:MAG: ATP synthase F1 subunit epsilon [Firmicutes bacterium]|jgi:F-type H+-transporting ATPase subunit epsilon|nr:ATP synthase F1 subunit epsilon [Bacillota bacterium]
MKDGIHLEIATAGGSVYDDMVSYVELPFSGGSVGVLKDHAPMLGAIEDGVVTARKENGATEFIAVNLGVANVVHNEVTLLVRTAERAENIDLPRAEAAEKRARDRLAEHSANLDVKRAQIALHRSLTRQAAVLMMKGR